jgi:hypothetical protein
MGVRCGSPGNHTSGSGLSSCRLWRPNPSLKLTRLSPRLYLGGWAESEAGQRGVSDKPAAQLSSTRWAAAKFIDTGKPRTMIWRGV